MSHAGQYNLDTFDGELNQAAVNEHHAETVNVSQAPVVEYVNPSLAPPVQPSRVWRIVELKLFFTLCTQTRSTLRPPVAILADEHHLSVDVEGLIRHEVSELCLGHLVPDDFGDARPVRMSVTSSTSCFQRVSSPSNSPAK